MTRWILLLSLFAGPALAFAGEVRGPRDCAELRKKDPKARCKDLALDGDEVEGEIAQGDGQVIPGRVPVKWGSLIKVRLSMMDKLVRSAENVGH